MQRGDQQYAYVKDQLFECATFFSVLFYDDPITISCRQSTNERKCMIDMYFQVISQDSLIPNQI